MQASHTARALSPQVRFLVGLVGSLVVHGAVLLLILFGNSGPPLHVDFFLPDEIEFGLTEGMTVAAAPHAAGSAESETPASPPPAGEGDGPRTRDAGISDGGNDHDAGRRRRHDAGVSDAGADDAATALATASTDGGTSVLNEGQGALTTYAPPGAQLSVRFDLAAIRATSLHEQVAALMRAIPDWQLLLDGSDIDPVEDLDRLFIASTNLQRANWVMSGKYTGDRARVERAVSLMAAARGRTVTWSDENGIPIAPWPNLDDVDRSIALVGPNQFTITRTDDLPRVLAVARARAEEINHRPDAGLNAVPMDDAEALLALPEGEIIAAEVEGAHNFVRGAQAAIIPSSVHAGISQLPDHTVVVTAHGQFESQDACRLALRVWDEQRLGFARSPVATFMGLSGAFTHATLACESALLQFRTEFSEAQVVRLMSIAATLMPRLPPAQTEHVGPPAPTSGDAPNVPPSTTGAPSAPATP